MLNFRKLRQDFSTAILKEGKELFEKESVIDAKILHMDCSSLRVSSRVRGQFETVYESEVEIDRSESIAIDSNCDCTYTYDCQHIAALLCFLEQKLPEIVVHYSQQTNLEEHGGDDHQKKQLRETFEEAATKVDLQKDLHYQREVLSNYIGSAKELGSAAFFLPPEKMEQDQAELAIQFLLQPKEDPVIQLAIRLPNRSKPLLIPNLKNFLDAIRYREALTISGKRYFFTPLSFNPIHRGILELLLNKVQFLGFGDERLLRTAKIDMESLGEIMARSFDLATQQRAPTGEPEPLPCLFYGNLEEPLYFSTFPAEIKFTIQYLEAAGKTFLLKPSIRLEEESIDPDNGFLFESNRPGIISQNIFYRFQPQIKRLHLKELKRLREITVPEPLFGTFVENALPVLRHYAEVTNPSILNQFVTLPYVDQIRGKCRLSYLNGELEATLFFIYDNVEIPAAVSQLTYEQATLFVEKKGILARNLVEERKLIETLFEDFLFDDKEGVFRVKSEKKIVEFMTEVIPNHQDQIQFECPENLSDQFIYDDSKFELSLSEGNRIDTYQVALKIDGYLKGVRLDVLWDCVSTKKRFVELNPVRGGKRVSSKIPRILVLDLEKISPLVQLFDEIGLTLLEDKTEARPLWSLTGLQPSQFDNLPVKFSMTNRLKEIQKQLLGETNFTAQPIPSTIKADLRNYQAEGVHWLERLRKMHLGGILADDMGLGKSLQAITAITQSLQERPDACSLIVCPTSLVYNWKEEFQKFNPQIKTIVIDSIPAQRKKLLQSIDKYHVVITSYNLLQKDIEVYKELSFDYVVLDEAHHIKNRGTRNAKSVKQIKASHRLVLTGTPIENSLEELWSLFDFLMPGFLSSFDRFIEKYIRNNVQAEKKATNLMLLKKKVAPFIMRRMKEDVLEDLPPISEILYYCSLTETQKTLYHSYAASAKEELSRLVKKEGFDKIQIHVLATLTRLKQICCHPAIFAKEVAEPGDSAKYDMLFELLLSLIEGKHKTVIFSQYTKMLGIMRNDLQQKGIPFSYLDGSSKNRLNIVKEFNEDPNIPVFLVSLKAGGSGLNLVGADTIILFDMWWNPAVDDQATDRVHRMGQSKPVSSFKLVTLNTIEEKILNLQNKKKSLVKNVISSDDEIISKLTWEEILELLQT